MPKDPNLNQMIRTLAPLPGLRIYTCNTHSLSAGYDPPLISMLGTRELNDWHTRFEHRGRRNEWLAGRLAGKQAILSWFGDASATPPPPDQLEILSDEQGAPHYAGPWKYDAPRLPELSITHTDGLAAAVVHHVKRGLYPGIDMERQGRRLSDRVIRNVFSLEEEAVINTLPPTDRSDWRLRLWCAREAAAKSLRMGLVGLTHHFRAEEIDFKAGTVYVAVVGVPGNRRLFGNKCTIAVKTWLHESYIMAVSVIQ